MDQPITPPRACADNTSSIQGEKYNHGNGTPQVESIDADSYKVNGRIAYIDCLRGFTMLLVIWNHVADMSFGLGVDDSFWTQLFVSFRMPTFFFISGFIAYKIPGYFTKSNVCNLVAKKARVQLIPMLVFWFIGILLIKGRTLAEVPSTFMGWFPGFWWFTEALFLMFLLYYSASFIERLCRIKNVSFFIMAIEAIVMMMTINKFSENIIAQKLLYSYVGKYFMYFVFGLFICKYRTQFYRLLSNNIFITTCLIAVFVICYLCYGSGIEFSHNEMAIVRSLMGFPFICVIFALFHKSAAFWASNHRISQTLRFIGRRTLDLYVLHFFFIPNMKIFHDYLSGVQQTVQQITVVSLVTLVVAGLCLMVSVVVRLSPFLAKYLFGVQQKKMS